MQRWFARAPEKGIMEVSSAGHLPAFLLQKGKVRSLDASSTPLGMFCNGDYPTEKVRLEPGESLVFYTDGLTESRDAANNEYALNRLAQFLDGRHALEPGALTAA